MHSYLGQLDKHGSRNALGLVPLVAERRNVLVDPRASVGAQLDVRLVVVWRVPALVPVRIAVCNARERVDMAPENFRNQFVRATTGDYPQLAADLCNERTRTV